MKKIILFLCVLSLMLVPFCAYADGAEDLLNGKQDMVVLGTVKDISGDSVLIAVDHILARDASKLIGKDITVEKFSYTYCDKHSNADFRSPTISDNIVISLKEEDSGYSMANCAYKVDSNEYASAKIVVYEEIEDAKCIEDILKVTSFVRANGMVNEFEFDSEGRIYAVYPQSIEQCVTLADADGKIKETVGSASNTVPAPHETQNMPNTQDVRGRGIIPVIIIILGAVLGFAVFYILGLKSGKKE